jgi:hypothetical protein
MKNIFRFLMAVAVLFTASCAKEDISSSIGGGEVEVTFTANLLELSSRAYGEGSEITTLRYEVYSNDERLGDLCGTTGITAATPITVNLVLIKGMSYDILFWADNGSDLYTINNGVVSFSADGILANDESRDAFYAAVKGFNPADANADTTIELYRPFAQLNAKVTNMDEVNKSITVTSTTISTKIFTTFNPFAENENEVVGGLTAEPVTFTATTMTAEDLVAGHLSMNYLLAPAGGCVADVAFTFNNDKNVPISGTTYTNVPLKANYRTNIIGALLTNSTDFTVEIKPAFNQPDQEPEELFMAAVQGGEVTLTEDVVLTQPLKVESKMTINLNGKTISNAGGYAIENYGELTISGDGDFEGLGGIRSHAGKLTINGGNYTCSSNWSNGTYNHILKAENSEVVINGGTFDATIGGTNNAMINVSENSVVTINGGTFKNVNGTIPQFAPYMFTYEKNGKLIINDGDFYGGWRFNGETATTDIYGGKFTVSYDGQSFHATSTHVVTIYGGVFSLENGGKLNPANHLAAGYKAVEKDGLYYVVAEGATVVTTTKEFSDALSSGGEIILFEDVALTKIDLTTQTQDVVINANGNTITTSSNYGVQVAAGKNITLKNAKVEITVEGNYITYAAGLKVENGDYQGKTILLENCDIQMINGDWAYAVNMPASVKNLNLVIDGCTLEGAIALQCWGDNNTITVTNSNLICNYTTSALYTSYCVALQGDGANKAENNTLNISGCNFSYTGIDNYNSPIKAIYNWSNSDVNNTNTITVVDCTYDNKVTPFN